MIDLNILIHTLCQEPATTLKSALRIVHFLGLALGLGAATVLDLLILRFLLKGKISKEHLAVFQFGSSIVNAGLMILWASGIGFLIYYGIFDPAKLGNEKVWAKIAIVLVLTINGMFIHSIILPKIKEQVGRSLMDGMTATQRSAFLVSGAVSATSWYVPMMLGALPQLNFVVPMATVLLVYAALLAIAILLSHAMIFAMRLDERLPSVRTPMLRIDPYFQAKA